MQVMSDAETLEHDSDSSVYSIDSEGPYFGMALGPYGYMFERQSLINIKRVLDRMRYSLRRLFNQGQLSNPSIWSNSHLYYRQRLRNHVSPNHPWPMYTLPRAQTWVSGVDDFDFGFTRLGTDVILRIRRNMRNYVRRWRLIKAAWNRVGIPLQWATVGSAYNSANGRSYGWVYATLGQRQQAGVGAIPALGYNINQ